MATLKQAKVKGLNVIPGTAMQWNRAYVESCKMVQAGMIGRIVSGIAYYKTSNEQYIKRQPGWSDAEFMIRTFFNWNWINGDQISNVLYHYINAFIWFSNFKPLNVSAIGSRVRRVAGNIYDNFSMDFTFEKGVRLFAQVRKMDGCDNKVGVDIQGEKGVWSSSDYSIHDTEGNLVWKYDEEAANVQFKTNDQYVLEHIDLVNHIRKGLVTDSADTNGISAMACIMARESAYSGKTLTWENMVASDLNMLPTEFASGQLGPMDMKKYETVPLPGIASIDS
jgi:predicted dehydrogenase